MKENLSMNTVNTIESPRSPTSLKRGLKPLNLTLDYDEGKSAREDVQMEIDFESGGSESNHQTKSNTYKRKRPQLKVELKLFIDTSRDDNNRYTPTSLSPVEKLRQSPLQHSYRSSNLPKSMPYTPIETCDSRHRRRNRYKFEITKVEDGLFIGGEAAMRDKSKLIEKGITSVLDCACKEQQNHATYYCRCSKCLSSSSTDRDFECPHRASVKYATDEFESLSLYLRDDIDQDATGHLYNCINFIETVKRRGGSVFVYCKQGISRSATIVIAYLMWKHNWTYDVASRFLKKKRPTIEPKIGFAFQLTQTWEKLRPSLVEHALCYRVEIEAKKSIESKHMNQTESKMVNKLGLTIGPLGNNDSVANEKKHLASRCQSDGGWKTDGCNRYLKSGECLLVCPGTGQTESYAQFQYIWCGPSVTNALVNEARRNCQQFHLLEGAPKDVRMVRCGQETQEFWNMLQESRCCQ